MKKLLSLFSSRLPVGLTEFQKWSDDIIDLSGLPKNDTMKWALAVMLIESDKTLDRKPKAYYASKLRKAAANEIASQFMQDLYAQKAAKEKEAKENLAVEGTIEGVVLPLRPPVQEVRLNETK